MEIPHDYEQGPIGILKDVPLKVYKTSVAIIGSGPAGLAAREELMKHNVDCIVVDNNDKIGGQFLMQTHQFFFFEKEQKFGGMRGFDMQRPWQGRITGDIPEFHRWDILEGGRIAVKNILTEEIIISMPLTLS